MLCPNCHQPPMSFVKFWRASHVLKIECERCGAKLKMPFSSQVISAAAVGLTIVLVAIVLFGPKTGPYGLPDLGRYFLLALVGPLVLLTGLRAVLWYRPYDLQ